MKMSWEILVDEEDLELWGVRIQVGLLQSPLITLLIVKGSPPLQTTTFSVNTENCPKTECSQHQNRGEQVQKVTAYAESKYSKCVRIKGDENIFPFLIPLCFH